MGPSGIGVWSAPSVDAKRKLLYVTTGDHYTPPETPTSDSVVALDLTTGAERWVRKLFPGDVWNGSCMIPGKDGCPDPEGPDYDFGSSPVLVHLPTETFP